MVSDAKNWEILGWVRRSKSGKTYNVVIDSQWYVISKKTIAKLDAQQVDGVPIKKCPRIEKKE